MIDALWTISRKVKAQPGEVQSMVLCHSRFNVRHLAAEVCGDEGPEVWLNENATTLTRIGDPVAGFGPCVVTADVGSKTGRVMDCVEAANRVMRLKYQGGAGITDPTERLLSAVIRWRKGESYTQLPRITGIARLADPPPGRFLTALLTGEHPELLEPASRSARTRFPI